MTAETLLRLALVPAAVWLASLAARRWGHSVSGYLGGFPLIGGPITLYLALDHGEQFAARSATVTLARHRGPGAHLLAFPRRAPRPVAVRPRGGMVRRAAIAVIVSWPLPPPLGRCSRALGRARGRVALRCPPDRGDATPAGDSAAWS